HHNSRLVGRAEPAPRDRLDREDPLAAAMGEPAVTRPDRSPTAPGQHRVPASGPRLHYDAIRSKAAHLGLTAKELDTALGVRLDTLEEDRDQRGVSLTVLDRLRRILDMPLDDLVID